MKKVFLISMLLCGLPSSIYAQDRGKEDIRQAMKLTRDMVGDLTNRRKQAESGSKNDQAIYDLAMSMYTSIITQSKGSPDQMQNLVEEGFSNPEDFAKKWSPSQLQRLQSMSGNSSPSPTTEKKPESERLGAKFIQH